MQKLNKDELDAISPIKKQANNMSYNSLCNIESNVTSPMKEM